MATPSSVVNATDAYARMEKAILRRSTINRLVAAIKRDLETLPKDSELARRSVKVLDYMRGYIEAVDNESAAAVETYAAAAYRQERRRVLAEKKNAAKA